MSRVTLDFFRNHVSTDFTRAARPVVVLFSTRSLFSTIFVTRKRESVDRPRDDDGERPARKSIERRANTDSSLVERLCPVLTNIKEARGSFASTLRDSRNRRP